MKYFFVFIYWSDTIFKKIWKNLIEEGRKKALKHVDMEVKGLGWNIIEYTNTGLPSVEGNVL